MWNVNHLVDKFPDLFHPLHSEGSRHSAQLFGIECHNGWYDILDECFTKIREDNERSAPLTDLHEFGAPYFHQVKEKWGALRIYMSTTTDAIEKIINDAEDKSKNTCEECGKPGTIQCLNRWYYSRCPDCMDRVRSRNVTVQNIYIDPPEFGGTEL